MIRLFRSSGLLVVFGAGCEELWLRGDAAQKWIGIAWRLETS